MTTIASTKSATIGETIRRVRSRRGMSMAEVAKEANISSAYMSILEAGKRDPSMGVVKAIAYAMRVPVTVLVAPLEDQDVLSLYPETFLQIRGMELQALGR